MNYRFLRIPGLSREHLVLENGANGWTVRDAGSHNGTRVNGMRLTAPANLTDGDRIKAGHLTIRYATGGNAKESRTESVAFIAQEPALSTPPVSVDLKSALEKSTDVAGQPTLGNAHLGALVRAGRERLGASGLVIGIMGNATYQEETCTLERGDILILFSDGLTEACNPGSGEDFGEERLIAVLKKEGDQPSAKLIDSIKAAVSSFTGGEAAADDITIVVARRI